MDHDLRVRQCLSLSLSAAREKECTHARCHADADGGHITFDILHCVINRPACCHGAAGAVNVKADVLGRILGFQEKHLGYHQSGCLVIHLIPEENNSLLQKAGVDIVASFSLRCLFNDIWYKNIIHTVTSKLMSGKCQKLYLDCVVGDQRDCLLHCAVFTQLLDAALAECGTDLISCHAVLL